MNACFYNIGPFYCITLPVKYTPSSRSLDSSNICGMDSWSDLDRANLDNFSYNMESTCLPNSAEFSGIAFSANSLLSTSNDLPLLSDFFTRETPKTVKTIKYTVFCVKTVCFFTLQIQKTATCQTIFLWEWV